MAVRRKPGSVQGLEELGRERLSENFFMRDFLLSEISNLHGIPNIPDDPGLAVRAGRKLCQELLEPLHESFGGISIRSAYRSPAVNEFGNKNGHNCATNKKNRARHIWDQLDEAGQMGAMACFVVRWFGPRCEEHNDWHPLAWWIHDKLPYSELMFFPKLAAFNISWHEAPKRLISSYAPPKGTLTQPGMDNHEGSHESQYQGFPELVRGGA
ncbi:MAG: hypothetical protein QGF09_06010 [Rhodospirillales bacterium]|nr:hypothetical protein [Rhodospirillales bacterium]